MTDNQTNQRSKEAQEYFDSLPVFVQESIMQTGVALNTKTDLEQCAKNMTQQSR